MTILEYLEAWDMAAMKGHVTHSSEIWPGDDEPLDLIAADLEEQGVRFEDFLIKRDKKRASRERKMLPTIPTPRGKDVFTPATDKEVTVPDLIELVKEDLDHIENHLLFIQALDPSPYEIQRLEKICTEGFETLNKILRQVKEVKSHAQSPNRNVGELLS